MDAPAATLPPLATHPSVYGNLLELIGDTPLVALTSPEGGAQVWGKLESWNPGGSTKDRVALALLEAAKRDGLLSSGIVVEPTSGNTGIGLALVCRRLGYRCVLTMPETMSLERRALLESMGAELVLTPGERQMAGAIEKAEELSCQYQAFMPRQFDNPNNPEIHAQSTAREILHALADLPLQAFVAGVGTGGTISGVGRVLREERPSCQIIAVEPESCATLSRGDIGPSKIQGLAPGFVPQNYHRSVVSEVRTVSDRAAMATKRALARSGILVGISAGAAVAVAFEVASALSAGDNVVAMLPDTGERYFSLDEYFDE